MLDSAYTSSWMLSNVPSISTTATSFPKQFSWVDLSLSPGAGLESLSAEGVQEISLPLSKR